jgi:hypothetical protein
MTVELGKNNIRGFVCPGTKHMLLMLYAVTSEASVDSGGQADSEDRSVSVRWVDSALSPRPAFPASPGAPACSWYSEYWAWLQSWQRGI